MSVSDHEVKAISLYTGCIVMSSYEPGSQESALKDEKSLIEANEQRYNSQC